MLLLEPLIKKLSRAQDRLLRTADGVPCELWRTAPAEGAWSAAEVIAHVMVVERTVISAAERIFQKQPKHVPLMKRFRMPFALVEIRFIKMKTPIPLDPLLLREKEVMLAELREVRVRTLSLIEETRNRDLGAYRWRHPFLGFLNGYEWFAMLGSHQIRHEKQIREIAATLQSSCK